MTASTPSCEYIYAGSSLLAKIEGGVTNYYHPDHLSARVTTDSSGNIAGQQGHYPFGDSWYAQSTTTKWAFTSYEHDPESGNDYALARSYVNRVGRFSSPDPLSGSLGDPQSLNRFSYVGNDPANLVDPLGLFPNGPPQYVCEISDPFHLGCPPQGPGGGGGNCTLDGISTPCGTVIAVVQAGASTSSITGGAGGTFQVWTPGGCVATVDEGNGNLVQSSSSAPSCTNGYWSTVTLGGNSLDPRILNDRLSSDARQILGQTRNLAQGPINVLSVVFVVEVGGILVVEAAPAAGVAASNVSAAAANVNATVTVAGEVYIGWQNIYQFISGFVNTNAPPVTPAAYLGNMAGKAFRGLTSR